LAPRISAASSVPRRDRPELTSFSSLRGWILPAHRQPCGAPHQVMVLFKLAVWLQGRCCCAYTSATRPD